jgi:hypothetical protein
VAQYSDINIVVSTNIVLNFVIYVGRYQLSRMIIIQGYHFVWTRACFFAGDKPVAVTHVPASSCPNKILALCMTIRVLPIRSQTSETYGT